MTLMKSMEGVFLTLDVRTVSECAHAYSVRTDGVTLLNFPDGYAGPASSLRPPSLIHGSRRSYVKFFH